MNKLEVFKLQTKTKKQIFLAMLTTNGVKPNLWYQELVDGEVTLADFFK